MSRYRPRLNAIANLQLRLDAWGASSTLCRQLVQEPRHSHAAGPAERAKPPCNTGSRRERLFVFRPRQGRVRFADLRPRWSGHYSLSGSRIAEMGLQSSSSAKVAELADAPDLRSGSRKALGVRLPPFAMLTGLGNWGACWRATVFFTFTPAIFSDRHQSAFQHPGITRITLKAEFIDVSDHPEEPRGRDPEHGGRRRD